MRGDERRWEDDEVYKTAASWEETLWWYRYGALCEEEFIRALKHFSVVLSNTRDIIRTGIANLVAMPPRGSFISVNLAALKAN